MMAVYMTHYETDEARIRDDGWTPTPTSRTPSKALREKVVLNAEMFHEVSSFRHVRDLSY